MWAGWSPLAGVTETSTRVVPLPMSVNVAVPVTAEAFCWANCTVTVRCWAEAVEPMVKTLSKPAAAAARSHRECRTAITSFRSCAVREALPVPADFYDKRATGGCLRRHGQAQHLRRAPRRPLNACWPARRCAPAGLRVLAAPASRSGHTPVGPCASRARANRLGEPDCRATGR